MATMRHALQQTAQPGAVEAASLIPKLGVYAAAFIGVLRRHPGAAILPPPVLPPHDAALTWQNTLLAAPSFRRAHVELFEVPGVFAVLHTVVLPQLGAAAPIFGFDMIAGKAQATGVFLDYSAVTDNPPAPALSDFLPSTARADLATARRVPEWGTIFSSDMLAARPASNEDAETLLGLGEAALAYYLRHLPSETSQAVPSVVAGHTAYALAQRRNPHTLRVLARYIGAAPARAFMDDVLFPLPP